MSLPDNDNQPHSNFGAFGKVFAITLLAGWIGAKLDQTAFGRWFNTNPIINMIFFLLRMGLILLITMCIGYYGWCVIAEFSR